ncbi:MFS transporter [Cupriavidus sp. USMAA2-4]|uniref:MFS transporter n=1 Tax=unclassified Cupriavidus TaxID=2640874 RepID=UPI0008A6D0D7|nr:MULTISPECIES: MFS transporter [unclassified Cupriavidus]AOY95418.1 MFS transporter [Cupriavidus sp. USMAA2-4]AOZ01666.1 MFS transporter [Cupriavidus sp. USMAHM13]
MNSATSANPLPGEGRSETPVTALEIGMFLVLLASYALNAMDRQIFPLIAADVRREFGFGLADTGLLSTIFTLGMALAGVPTGYLLARWSRKAVLQLGIAVFSLATLLTAYSSGFGDMIVYRAATGIGEAMQLTVVIAIAASYFARFRATAVGAINFSFGVGAIVGPLLGGHLIGFERNWRLPLIVFGLAGFAAMALIAVAVSQRMTEKAGTIDTRIDTRGATTMWNRNTVLLTGMSIIGGLCIYGYLGMYPTYLREHLHYTPADTGRVMSIFGGGVFASIFGGWLGDRFHPKLVLSLSFAGAGLLGVLLFSGPTGMLVQSVLSFAWGLVVSGVLYVNLAGYHIKSVRASLTNRATGVFVTTLYGAGAFAGYIIGGIAARFGWSAAGFLQITLLSVVGIALAMSLRTDRMSLRVRQP